MYNSTFLFIFMNFYLLLFTKCVKYKDYILDLSI